MRTTILGLVAVLLGVLVLEGSIRASWTGAQGVSATHVVAADIRAAVEAAPGDRVSDQQLRMVDAGDQTSASVSSRDRRPTGRVRSDMTNRRRSTVCSRGRGCWLPEER